MSSRRIIILKILKYNFKALYQKIKEVEFPLSLSFRSRLRQKTQEKIEEKQKNRVEKLKKEKQKKELESLNTSATNTNLSPAPDHDASSIPNQSKHFFKLVFMLIFFHTNFVFLKTLVYQFQVTPINQHLWLLTVSHQSTIVKTIKSIDNKYFL